MLSWEIEGWVEKVYLVMIFSNLFESIYFLRFLIFIILYFFGFLYYIGKKIEGIF